MKTAPSPLLLVSPPLQRHIEAYDDWTLSAALVERGCYMDFGDVKMTPIGLESFGSVSKCIVPSRHGGNLNSRQGANPLVSLVEGDERWETSDPPQGVLPQIWGETEQNRTVTCMVLKAKANDRDALI
ncbi:uncharacterized protein TNCV_3554051 [Trichonephila clavipes]|nr:uncharacterized protein TNCV_3554051 [Trichonephila clavipes]